MNGRSQSQPPQPAPAAGVAPYRSTPVFDAQGRKCGVLVINFLGAVLLDGLSESMAGVDRPLLVDTDGYWLKGLRAEDEWGFMFPERQNERFQKQFPTAWQYVLLQDSGQVMTKRGLFTFSSLRYPGPEGSEPSWKIVYWVPAEAWEGMIRNLRLF